MKKLSNISKLILIAALCLPVSGQMRAMNAAVGFSGEVAKAGVKITYKHLSKKPTFWGAVGAGTAWAGVAASRFVLDKPGKLASVGLVAGTGLVCYGVAKWFCENEGHQKTHKELEEAKKERKQITEKVDNVQITIEDQNEINRRHFEFLSDYFQKANDKKMLLVINMLQVLLREKAKCFNDEITKAFEADSYNETVKAEYNKIKDSVLNKRKEKQKELKEQKQAEQKRLQEEKAKKQEKKSWYRFW